MSQITWDAESWKQKFYIERPVDYHGLRQEVWKNTLEIVQNGSYTLKNGTSVKLYDEQPSRYSHFYKAAFSPTFERLEDSPVITVVSDDCLDTAHKWVNEGLSVSVLNMASRSNPGGGVVGGAGAQEEYLFRCSDYCLFLYRYAKYAAEYGLRRSHNQYPLDRNFGGIYSQGVTIFRENEESGYNLIATPWKVNMIAVAGIYDPDTIFENGEERIVPMLAKAVKNKIRTIFRIACDNEQRNLVLGALGCGAFHNPPKHVAELFRDVLCEQEFEGAFRKICFAIKTDHNSNGDRNFVAFKEVLDGYQIVR